MNDIIYQTASYKVIGACMEVHRELGCGFLEPVYQAAIEREFILQNIPYTKETQLNIPYKGKHLDKYYQADFICYDKIILEVKALAELIPEHQAQAINYLKATNFRLAILVNFGTQSLEYKRIPNKYYQE